MTCQLCERLKMEAQSHAMEARGANDTIQKIYQIVTGARGEPGNWNAEVPVRQEIERLRSELAASREVVTAACRLVAADTYVHPSLSRADAVRQGTAELYDAVGRWHGTQQARAAVKRDLTDHETHPMTEQ